MSTANGTGAQNWTLSSSGVVQAGYYNLSTEGAYCLTAAGCASGLAVVLDPCAGSSRQAWAAEKSGSNYAFHPPNNTALCLDVIGAGTTSGTMYLQRHRRAELGAWIGRQQRWRLGQ